MRTEDSHRAGEVQRAALIDVAAQERLAQATVEDRDRAARTKRAVRPGKDPVAKGRRPERVADRRARNDRAEIVNATIFLAERLFELIELRRRLGRRATTRRCSNRSNSPIESPPPSKSTRGLDTRRSLPAPGFRFTPTFPPRGPVRRASSLSKPSAPWYRRFRQEAAIRRLCARIACSMKRP